jgi:hypothetical protein
VLLEMANNAGNISPDVWFPWPQNM